MSDFIEKLKELVESDEFNIVSKSTRFRFMQAITQDTKNFREFIPDIFHKELTVLEAVRLLIDATNEQLAKGQLTLFEGQESGSKKGAS